MADDVRDQIAEVIRNGYFHDTANEIADAVMAEVVTPELERLTAHILDIAAHATERVRMLLERWEQGRGTDAFPAIALRTALAALDTPTPTETWPPQVGDLWEANDGSRWFATDISLSLGDGEGPARIRFVNAGRAQMEPDELFTAEPRLISRRRPVTGETP